MPSIEQQLWCSVLEQAFIDATTLHANNPAAIRERKRARAWLTTPSVDLNEVCSLAGFEVGRVIASAKTKIEEAVKHDNDPASRGYNHRLANNTLLQHDGRSLTVSQWAEVSGIAKHAIYSRLRQGLTIEQALTKPFRSARHRGLGQYFSDRPANRMKPATPESTNIVFSLEATS